MSGLKEHPSMRQTQTREDKPKAHDKEGWENKRGNRQWFMSNAAWQVEVWFK